MFKKRRGIHLPYVKQGLIHFVCANYRDMPPDIQQKILNLCIEVGKEDYKALFEVMTDEYKSVLSVSLKYYISEKKLYSLRKAFYERWEKYMKEA